PEALPAGEGFPLRNLHSAIGAVAVAASRDEDLPAHRPSWFQKIRRRPRERVQILDGRPWRGPLHQSSSTAPEPGFLPPGPLLRERPGYSPQGLLGLARYDSTQELYGAEDLAGMVRCEGSARQ